MEAAVCELLVEDTYLGSIVNILCKEADETVEEHNWASQQSKDML
jgi:hypothetical protein